MKGELIPKRTAVRYVGNTSGNFYNSDYLGLEGETLFETRVSNDRNSVDIVLKHPTEGPKFIGVMRMNLEILDEEALPLVSDDEVYSDKYGDLLRVETGKQSNEDLVWLTATDQHGEATLEFTDRKAVLDLASHLMRIGLAMDKEEVC